MKHLSLLALLAIAAPLSWGEKLLSETPFYCSVEYQGGVQTKTMTLAKFKASPTEDFRLMPRSKVDASILNSSRNMALDTFTSSTSLYTLETNSYLLRQLGEDPSNPWVWYECKAYGSGKIERIECSRGLKHFAFDARTKRFAFSYLGTWHEEASNSDYSGDDAYFSFGTCKPYYD